MKIAISAGHHLQAKGAHFGDFYEYDETPRWRKGIADALGSHAWRVPTGPLAAKIRAINAQDCDAAVEIHFNASPSGKGSGHETLYCPNSIAGLRLAMHINSAIIDTCGPNRGVKEGWYRMDRPGHIDYQGDIEGDEFVDAFLKRTRCPAVIVEPLFIHEIDRINAVREEACRRIAQAILEWGGVTT